MSDSEIDSQPQEGDSERSTMSQNTQNIAHATANHSNNQTSISNLYHLIGLEYNGAWAFRMKNVLQRDGLYEYCITAPSQIMTDNEKKGR